MKKSSKKKHRLNNKLEILIRGDGASKVREQLKRTQELADRWRENNKVGEGWTISDLSSNFPSLKLKNG